jgi:hypothetical protein
MPKKSDEEKLLEDVLEKKIPVKKLCPLSLSMIRKPQGKILSYEFMVESCMEERCGWWSEKSACCGIRLIPNVA